MDILLIFYWYTQYDIIHRNWIGYPLNMIFRFVYEVRFRDKYWYLLDIQSVYSCNIKFRSLIGSPLDIKFLSNLDIRLTYEAEYLYNILMRCALWDQLSKQKWISNGHQFPICSGYPIDIMKLDVHQRSTIWHQMSELHWTSIGHPFDILISATVFFSFQVIIMFVSFHALSPPFKIEILI